MWLTAPIDVYATAPCLMCKEHTITCHGTCERYKAYVQENERAKYKVRVILNADDTHSTESDMYAEMNRRKREKQRKKRNR